MNLHSFCLVNHGHEHVENATILPYLCDDDLYWIMIVLTFKFISAVKRKKICKISQIISDIFKMKDHIQKFT